MPHVVLLGDSTFDNQRYIPYDDPDVVHQLHTQLPADWRATLLAVDGAVTDSVPRQLANLPEDATHLIVSVGGNDALGHLNVLDGAATSVAQALARLGAIQDQFEQTYRRMLGAVLARNLPTAVCTIYNGSFSDPAYQRIATVGVAIWDDAILRIAAERGLPVLELRLICSDPADYANPIEPSTTGGAKLATAMARLLATHDFTRDGARIYTLPTPGV